MKKTPCNDVEVHAALSGAVLVTKVYYDNYDGTTTRKTARRVIRNVAIRGDVYSLADRYGDDIATSVEFSKYMMAILLRGGEVIDTETGGDFFYVYKIER